MPLKSVVYRLLIYKENSTNCYFSIYLLGWETLDIYTYVMDGDNIQCTPGHFVMIVPRGGDKLEITIKKSSMKNTPSFTFIPTPDCENSAYVATEKVAGKYYYLCGDAEARYKFEDLFEDERCAEFKNLVDNYGK